jgi:hypothetical protein
MPFDPREITPNASLNRVRIIDLPGLRSPYALRDEERGKTAYELLGAQAVYNLIRERAHLLELPRPLPERPTHEVMSAFQQCFTAINPLIQKTANEIRALVDRRIAILLAVLRRGDPVNREARPEWDKSYWDYWGTSRQIIVGGGLLRDNLGYMVQNSVQGFFFEANSKRKHRFISIRRDPYGAYWPLVGAACAANPDLAHTAILDFGGTSVKAGIAHTHQGKLTSIQEHGSFPGPLGEPYSLTPQSEEDKWLIFHAMVDRIAQTILGSSSAASITHAIVSVAAYIAPDGHPYPNSTGGYAGLQTLAPNLQQALAEAVSEKVGRTISLRLLHDGTAAATAYPGRAVIVFGTAIGVGTHHAASHPLQTDKPPLNLLD